MISSHMGSVPAQFPQKSNVIDDCGAPGPMPQQDAVGSHGHEMHPQKFVQLVGCHDSNAARQVRVCTNSLHDRRAMSHGGAWPASADGANPAQRASEFVANIQAS